MCRAEEGARSKDKALVGFGHAQKNKLQLEAIRDEETERAASLEVELSKVQQTINTASCAPHAPEVHDVVLQHLNQLQHQLEREESPSQDQHQRDNQLQELGRRCAEIDERWQETLVSLEKKEKQLKEVQRERDEEQGKMRDACKVAAFHSEQLHELDQYCKQLDAQLIKKDQELIECRQKLKHDESQSFEQNTELNMLQQKLECMESKSMEVQGRLAEK